MKSIIILLALLMLLISCNKDNSGDFNNKPSMIIEKDEEGDIEVSYFYYNGDNVSKIERADKSKIVFDYSENRIIRDAVYSNNATNAWIKREYSYNSNNQVEKVSYMKRNGDNYTMVAFYFYEYLNEKIYKEYYYDIDDQDTSFYNFLEFDSNNNLIKKTRYDRGSPVENYHLVKDIIYEYDNNNHYFSNINYPCFASFSSQINNKTKETVFYGPHDNTSQGVIINYKYVYNSDGYPIYCIKDIADTVLWIKY